jgi:hypothetical protein
MSWIKGLTEVCASGIAFGYPDKEIRAVRMEEGPSMTRDDTRRVLGQALEEAAACGDDVAPDDYLGHLFVDAAEISVEANQKTISNGSHKSVAVRDFGARIRAMPARKAAATS